MNESESHFYPSQNATTMFGHMSEHNGAALYRYGAHTHAQHQKQQINQQQRQPYAQDLNQNHGGSPVHEIYRTRSARSFTDILRSPGPSPQASRGTRSSYSQQQEQRQREEEEQQALSIAALASAAAARAAMHRSADGGLDLEAQQSRQERLLHRIELRLDRLEEQHERQLLRHPMKPASSAFSSDSQALSDSITRLLNQMQAQQQQMHRMQQQMDELRHSMEMALLREKTTQSAVEELQKRQLLASSSARSTDQQSAGATDARSLLSLSPLTSVDDTSNLEQPNSATSWLNTAVIVSVLFAFIGFFVAVVAMMRANDSRRAQTSAEVAAQNALAAAVASSSYYHPLELSRSGRAYPPYLSPQPYATSGSEYFRRDRSPYVSRV